MNKKLIIMRGPSGSGKSTLAKKLVGDGVIHSTDDLIYATGDYQKFWEDMKGTDGSAILKLHSKNLKNAKESMNNGVSPVIIDNMNIRPEDSKPYVKYGLKKGYEVIIESVNIDNLTGKDLVERSNHFGLDSETLKDDIAKLSGMITSFKAFKDITVEKIMASKDKRKPFIWSSVKLDTNSKAKLLNRVGHLVPDGWKIIGEHMTLKYGQTLKSIGEDGLIGQTLLLKVIGYGISDMALAVEVEGFKKILGDRKPHITIAINEEGGAVPVMSNDITKWVYFRDLDESYITLSGKVDEIKN